MNLKKISIITVCRNAELYINKTIESVYGQEFADYEYIIIDGASNDKTIKIANSYLDKFEKKHISYTIISEPDTGIYNAMNKGLEHAKGEWVIFINAGDLLYDNNILRTLFETDYNQYDVVYGDVVVYENNKYKKAYVGIITEETIHSPLCHQGVMVKTELMKNIRFNEKYRLAADYDSLLRIFTNNGRFLKIDKIISVFLQGGMSSQQDIQYLKEMIESRKENNVKNKINPRVLLFRLNKYNLIRKTAKLVLGKYFYSNNRGWFIDKSLISK